MSNEDLQPRMPEPALPEMAEVNPQTYDPVNDLFYTRSIRGMIVKSLGNKGIPKDPKELQMLLTTLKDQDSAALNQMKIKTEEKGIDQQGQHQKLVAEFLRSRSGLGKQVPVAPAGTPSEPPVLSDDTKTRDFVPGELEQGTVALTFDEFVAATGDLKLAEVDKPD